MEELEIIAAEIEKAYVTWKSKKLPYWRPSAKDKAAFLKAAALAQELESDPYVFIDAVVAGQDQLKHFTGYLHSAVAKQKAMERRVENDNKITYEEEFETNKLYLRTQIQSGTKIEDALMIGDIPFNAWFRIAVTKEPIKQIIDRFGKEALKEMTPSLLAFLEKQGLELAKRIT